MNFQRRVWYRALCLRYACVQSSGIIHIPCATFMSNFVSFAASVAELARGEKLRSQSLTQSINHLAYLMHRKPSEHKLHKAFLDQNSQTLHSLVIKPVTSVFHNSSELCDIVMHGIVFLHVFS